MHHMEYLPTVVCSAPNCLNISLLVPVNLFRSDKPIKFLSLPSLVVAVDSVSLLKQFNLVIDVRADLLIRVVY